MVKYYTYYFQQLAINNINIADTPTAKAFFYVQDIYNPDAFDEAIRSLAKPTVMLLERYRTKLNDGGSRNARKQLLGRFDILIKTDPGDPQTIVNAYDQAESIAEDTIAKMREQLLGGQPIIIPNVGQSKKVFFEEENIEIDQFGPIDNSYYGVSVSFVMKTAGQAQSIPANWTD